MLPSNAAALDLASVLPIRVSGLRSWTGSPSWSVILGFPAVVCAATSIPTMTVTKRRSSRACIGNPKPEQETIASRNDETPEGCVFQRDVMEPPKACMRDPRLRH